MILVQFHGNSISLSKCSPLAVGERKQCENKTPQRSLHGHYLVPRPFWGFWHENKGLRKGFTESQGTKGRLNNWKTRACFAFFNLPMIHCASRRKRSTWFRDSCGHSRQLLFWYHPMRFVSVPSKSNPLFSVVCAVPFVSSLTYTHHYLPSPVLSSLLAFSVFSWNSRRRLSSSENKNQQKKLHEPSLYFCHQRKIVIWLDFTHLPYTNPGTSLLTISWRGRSGLQKHGKKKKREKDIRLSPRTMCRSFSHVPSSFTFAFLPVMYFAYQVLFMMCTLLQGRYSFFSMTYIPVF